jgi:2-oxoisovalerate dehydrogenase E2 component (dihydrolipoyl transacylase)
MTVHTIKVPDIGEGVAEVELVAWRVSSGDSVAEDQALVDLLTDKATVEVPSPVAGRVLALGGEVGQMLAVGAELIRIEVDDAHTTATLQGSEAATGEAPGSATPAPALGAQGGAAPGPAWPVPTPRGSEAKPSPQQHRPIASPAVRARAWELGIDLNEVSASGTAGRIVHADLDAFAARGATQAKPQPLPRAAASSDAIHAVKIVGLRRRIAQRMQDSKRRIPHYTYVEEVDVSELEALRGRLNAKWGAQRGHLTLLPFLARAIARAVREFPQVNSHFDDAAGVLTQHDAVHVGIATQTDGGLMVPVLRDAHLRDLWGAAAEVLRLARATRSGKVVRNELSGSTITLSSLGALGGIMSTPVINPPEVAIVGVNAIVMRPVFRGGAVVARQMMNLSSSFDHRVVDGAIGAAFVQSLRQHLEHPATLFVE